MHTPEYLPLAAQGLLPDPAASEDRDDMSIEEIVERYRVETNPDGTVEFPGGFLGGIFGNTEIQTTEAAVLDELSLLEQKDFKDIQGDALSTAEERYPGYALHNDQADAFRHAYWSALMATRLGEGFSKASATPTRPTRVSRRTR